MATSWDTALLALLGLGFVLTDLVIWVGIEYFKDLDSENEQARHLKTAILAGYILLALHISMHIGIVASIIAGYPTSLFYLVGLMYISQVLWCLPAATYAMKGNALHVSARSSGAPGTFYGGIFLPLIMMFPTVLFLTDVLVHMAGG